MSETKWTPGPWRVREGPVVDSNTHTIALVTWDPLLMDDPDEESAANADLISAAPDLYEALAWAIKRIPLETARNESARFQEAIAALARAEVKP